METSEREGTDGTNSCFDIDRDESAITSDGGCLAFRDTTYDSQNYSQDGIDCTPCLLTPNSDSCRAIQDSCDTNTILRVKKDRVCSEWVACKTATVEFDDDGNPVTTCLNGSLDRCVGLDENGNCKDWINPKPSYDQLNSTTDVHFTSAPGATAELVASENLTGFVKAGLTWVDTKFCESGTNAGFSCVLDEDCTDDDGTLHTCSDPVQVEGYYPYGWMAEIGEAGSQYGTEIIEHNDFEQLYCAGTFGDSSVSCIQNASDQSIGNCYSRNLQTQVDSRDNLDIEDVLYFDNSGDGGNFLDNGNNAQLAFCPNSPNFGEYWPFGDNGLVEYTDKGWQPSNTSTSVVVTQYDTARRLCH